MAEQAAGHYITADDIDNWPSGTTADEQQAIIDVAEAVLEAALRTSYYPKPFDIRLNGNGKDRLFLPLKAGIVSVSLVTVSEVELDSAYWSFDKASVFSCPGSGAVSNVEREYLATMDDGGSMFPRGFNNVRVVGTCGAASVPSWVKLAATILARNQNDPTQYTQTMASENIGGYSYSMAKELAETKGLTGVKEADDIIKLFRRGRTVIMAP